MLLRILLTLGMVLLIGCTTSKQPEPVNRGIEPQSLMAPTYFTTGGLRRAELSIASTTAGYTDSGNTEDTDNDFTTTGGAADYEWMARKFTAVNTGKVVTVAVILKITGAPAGTIAASIYSDDGGSPSKPSAVIGVASDSVTSSGLSTDAAGASQTFTWSGDGPDIVASTVYWLVLKTTGYTYANGVTEVIWRTDANGATGLNECGKYDSNASPAWTSMGADVGADLTVNSSANWEITTDVWGDAIPNEMRLEKIVIAQATSTLYDFRIHAKSTRLLADLAYRDTWYEGESASATPLLEESVWASYFNADRSSKIMGDIRVKSGESASAFTLVLEFR